MSLGSDFGSMDLDLATGVQGSGVSVSGSGDSPSLSPTSSVNAGVIFSFVLLGIIGSTFLVCSARGGLPYVVSYYHRLRSLRAMHPRTREYRSGEITIPCATILTPPA